MTYNDLKVTYDSYIFLIHFMTYDLEVTFDTYIIYIGTIMILDDPAMIFDSYIYLFYSLDPK